MYKNNNKKIIATIEARMTSSRLPGKVLLPLAGRPALERLIDRLRRSRYLDGIVVATTVNEKDNPIMELANKIGVDCFRGSEEDVLGRVLGAAQTVAADIIVEITGDCPLVDPSLVDKGIEEFFVREVDYAANISPETYPIGFDVQVFPVEVLARADRETQDYLDRVHVSYYMRRNPENKFRLHHWGPKPGEKFYAPTLRLTLDEPADYELLDAIFRKLLPQNENFRMEDVMELLTREPNLLKINKHVRQKQHQEG